MRTLEINYLTTLIDNRDEQKYNADIYFRKALGIVTDWIQDTAILKIKPKGIFQNAFNKLSNQPNEDPFDTVFNQK